MLITLSEQSYLPVCRSFLTDVVGKLTLLFSVVRYVQRPQLTVDSAEDKTQFVPSAQALQGLNDLLNFHKFVIVIRE